MKEITYVPNVLILHKRGHADLARLLGSSGMTSGVVRIESFSDTHPQINPANQDVLEDAVRTRADYLFIDHELIAPELSVSALSVINASLTSSTRRAKTSLYDEDYALTPFAFEDMWNLSVGALKTEAMKS